MGQPCAASIAGDSAQGWQGGEGWDSVDAARIGLGRPLQQACLIQAGIAVDRWQVCCGHRLHACMPVDEVG